MLQTVTKKQLTRLIFAGLLYLFASGFCFAQKSNGFFRVEQRNGVWWFITPDNKPFFSNGVNVVSQGSSRENYNEKNPQYAAFHFYPTTDAWSDDTLKRLREWNFNTIGSWSNEDLSRRGALPYTKVLHLGEKRVPWDDVFSKEFLALIDENARREIGNLKTDKNLIGYFSDNELGWWDDSVFQHFLGEPVANKTRQVLVKLLREHYKSNFADLQRDFETKEARNFADLERNAADVTLKPNGRGAELIDKFMFLVAHKYYQTVRDAVRRYDSNHLILGDRYPGWYSQAVVCASIPFVDVVSTNYMADWTDGNISHFYLDTLYQLTKKPVIVTEYYMSATENSSGNTNSSAAFPVVATQKERAKSFRTNLTALVELPYIVGAHWFQYTDEPTFGRDGDGENYNFGLVDIHNAPYQDLTAAAKALNPALIHARSKTENAEEKNTGIPPAVFDAEKGLRGWNKKKSFVRSFSEKHLSNLPFADLYAAWDKDFLYLAIYAADFSETKFYAGGKIPESERMTWTVNFGAKKELLKARFGYGGETEISNKNIEFNSQNASTRFTMIVRLPASEFGTKQFASGDSIAFQSTLFSHSRAEKMEWNQTLKLGKALLNKL